MDKKVVLRSAKKLSGKGFRFEKNKLDKKSSKKRDSPSVNVKENVEKSSKRRKIVIEEPDQQKSKVGSKNWQYIIKPEDYFTAKIGSHIGKEVISNLKTKLSESQLTLFQKTCFGHFLGMPDFNFQPQLVHCLLLRELEQPIENELWICINGCLLKFSIKEFAVITGLNCVGECNKLSFCRETNSLMNKYFGGLKKINKQSVEECFLSQRWVCDDDAVKIAVLYFVHLFLLSSSKDKMVNKADFDIIDSGNFNEYPWGKEVFNVTIDSLKRKLHGKQKRNGSNFYRLIGFPLAFQVWFYECCPYVAGKLAILKDGSVPRILNWSSYSIPSYKFLQKSLFCESVFKLKLKNITPTAVERQQLKLDGFFSMGKKKYDVSDKEKYDDDDHNDDFESPGPLKLVGTSTSQQQKRSRSDVDGSTVKMRKQLKLVFSRQQKLSEDFSSLKLYLEQKFSEVFNCLNVIQSKLQSNRCGVGSSVFGDKYF